MSLYTFLRNTRTHFQQTPHDPDVWGQHPDRCFLCGLALDHDIHDI